MAIVTCAISGVTMDIPSFPKLNIQHTAGYLHPIFAASTKQLDSLYSSYARNQLSIKEGYLLLLATLHSTGKVNWEVPVSLIPSSKLADSVVHSNLPLLMEVTAKTAVIQLPSFKQPQYTVRADNSNLATLKNYLLAWQRNLDTFQENKVASRYADSLRKVENKLSRLIRGSESTATYTKIVAEWADKAAGFPLDKAEQWKRIIESCFLEDRMRNVDLAALQELKEYCDINLEVGTLHYFKLMEVLREGVVRHSNYLGEYSLLGNLSASSMLGHNYLDTIGSSLLDEKAGSAAVAAIVADAPTSAPIESDYPTKLAYIKAKLAYRIASNKQSPATAAPKDRLTTIAKAASKVSRYEDGLDSYLDMCDLDNTADDNLLSLDTDNIDDDDILYDIED
jgi:hypothetical protein